MKKYIFSGIFYIDISIVFLLTIAHTDLAASATLNDYWNGKADWKFVRKWSQNDLGDGTELDGLHIEVVGNSWYLFTRKTFPGSKWGTEVRRSTDTGMTWGYPVDIIVPEVGTPWEYVATDGQPVYDPIGNKWHYIFQCKNTPADQGEWNGCYAYKDGVDPMGYWTTPDKEEPLITSGSLWGKICQSGDDCYDQVSGKTLVEEGTFGALFLDGDTVWISFHGHDGSATRTFRGLVKTHINDIDTIENWTIVNDPATPDNKKVPNDAILDYVDGQPWQSNGREDWGQHGPVGPGHGSILQDGGYYYIFPEIANNTLSGSVSMTEGQKWDIGLLRTDNLSKTTWEQLNGGAGEYQNPVLYSSMPPLKVNPNGDITKAYQLLTLQYPRLFKDSAGTVYMIVARNYCHYDEEEEPEVGICTTHKNKDKSAIYLYRLEGKDSLGNEGRNVLKNSDFWIAHNEPYWFQSNSSDMVIYRRYWLSSDGNQFMQFNCGVSCEPGASIYQDVKVAKTQRGKLFTFGGKFASVGINGNAPVGTVQVVVHQLDSSGKAIEGASRQQPAGTSGPDYRQIAVQRDDLIIHDHATQLRYELYPLTPNVINSLRGGIQYEFYSRHYFSQTNR